MPDREEYINCIRHTHAEKLKESWCGRQVDLFEWTFMNIDHAAYNALNGGRLVACPDCVKAVEATLSS